MADRSAGFTSGDRWLGGAALAVLLLAGAMLVWDLRTPLASGWDEANYASQSVRDAGFARQGPLRLVKALLFEDTQRPPVYRILALPVAWFTAEVRAYRLVSVAAFGIVALLLAMTVRRNAGGTSAALAVLLFAAMPGVITSFVWYGTEFPLFLAVALQLFAIVDERLDARRRAVVHALAIGLGLWSKASFVAVAGPLGLLAIALLPARRKPLLWGAVGGVLLALPWWGWNWRSALAYLHEGRTYARAAVGPGTPLHTIAMKSGVLAFETIGLFAVAAIVLLAAAAAAHEPRPLSRAALVCLIASAALPLAAYASPVFVQRHIAPACLPLAAGVALLFTARGPSHRVAAWAAAALALQGLLVCAGLLVTSPVGGPVGALFEPLRVTPHVDWAPLVPSDVRRLAFLGTAEDLSPPQVEYSLLRRGRCVAVRWLWRSDGAPLVWTQLLQDAANADLVLISEASPAAASNDPFHEQDNAYNRELLARLSASCEFRQPTPLAVPGHPPYVLLAARHR